MSALYSFPNTNTNPFASMPSHSSSFTMPYSGPTYDYQNNVSNSHPDSIELFLETTTQNCPAVLADLISSLTCSLRYSAIVNCGSSNAVSIEFREFCRGLLRRAQLSTRVIIIGLQYLYRLSKRAPELCSQPGLDRQLLTVSLLLGMKYHEDIPYFNGTWSKLSGIPLSILNPLEMKVLEILEFDLYISGAEYERWICELEAKSRLIRNPFSQYVPRHEHYTSQSMPRGSHPMTMPMPLSCQQTSLIAGYRGSSSTGSCDCKLDSCNDLVPCPLHLSEYPSLL